MRSIPELAVEFERTQAGKLRGGMGEGDSELHDREADGDAQRGPAGDGGDLQRRAGACLAARRI